MKLLFQNSLFLALLTATLLYSARFSFLVSFYHFNNESFTELFCQNRDRPELECNGKCYLSDAGEDLEQEKNDLTLNKFQQEITFFTGDFTSKEFLPVKHEEVQDYFYLNLYTHLFSYQLLHPPKITS